MNPLRVFILILFNFRGHLNGLVFASDTIVKALLE